MARAMAALSCSSALGPSSSAADAAPAGAFFSPTNSSSTTPPTPWATMLPPKPKANPAPPRTAAAGAAITAPPAAMSTAPASPANFTLSAWRERPPSTRWSKAVMLMRSSDPVPPTPPRARHSVRTRGSKMRAQVASLPSNSARAWAVRPASSWARMRVNLVRAVSS